ncbi:MAG: glycine cleavage system protein GcvH [Verrucomicrobia bacterium]|nr:glycine cleavage system protein GcvH [Verrucomicrobiota bacterium]MCH8512780.1 glycine cleavage system protein GcvH [Kiritimatiellia bacterium]
MQVPQDLKYTDSHEWVRVEGNLLRVGITEFAQSQLADLTFVDLPGVGDDVDAGDEVAVVESVKAASDVYAPVAGKIVEVNEALISAPEAINNDPFGDGWLFVIEPADAADVNALMDAAAYKGIIPDE